MSTIIATMLVLSLTVVLFATIFVALRFFPTPTPQPSQSFETTAVLSGRTITGLTILYKNGPTLGPSTQIYAASQSHPGDISPPNGRAYFTIGSGLAGQSSWQNGQTWTISLTPYVVSPLTLPDNLTVTVITGGALAMRTQVPGPNPLIPPAFTSYGTAPSSPAVGAKFTFTVNIQDTNSVPWVNISLADIPGYTANDSKTPMTDLGNGTWAYTVPAGKTSSAQSGVVYYAIVSATDSYHQTSQVVLPVVFR